MRRRRFVMAASAVFATACDVEADEADAAPARRRLEIFAHGVASGDPLADAVVLWTRVSVAADEVRVRWIVAEDDELRHVVADGMVATSAARDHTVKVDAGGLEPGHAYYYAFELDGTRSPIGRTRTLPVGRTERARLAVVSCANFPSGYYVVYAALALRDDIDAVVHLGDYVYEYADGAYGSSNALGRRFAPTHECLSLDDYRRRHASYKLDPDLQDAHRRHPFITVWDDHEVANNAWRDGAANHQSGEGRWQQRRANAVQAYREWMPIRDEQADPLPIRRSFRWGGLLDLVMFDTRLLGRDRQLGGLEGLDDAKRTLLGDEQERWLDDVLTGSQRDGVAWRLLGQQVRMGQLRKADGRPTNFDAWDGYPQARERLLAGLEQGGVRDVVVLTGDMHSSWAIELHRDPFASPPSGALAVELVAPAVSSPINAHPPDLDTLLDRHPHVRWVDFAHRGYVLLDLDATRMIATWHLVEDVRTPHAEVPAARAFEVRRGEARLHPV
jgi:alkaline phosphatase D